MKKSDRLKAILEIIYTKAIETQDDLVNVLKSQGFNATQATVSRDVKELKLAKTILSDGRYAYTADPFTSQPHPSGKVSEQFFNLLNSGFKSVEFASNIVIVKTTAGMASPFALAIDQMKWPEVLGTVAGDDTILIVTRSLGSSAELAKRLKKLKQNKEGL
jgi:transcriptional regulator of arginine metabolism